jgi:hypothetical protein
VNWKTYLMKNFKFCIPASPISAGSRCNGSLLDFLNVIITAIAFLAPVSDCLTSLTRGVKHNIGGKLGQRLTVKQEKETPCIIQDNQTVWIIWPGHIQKRNATEIWCGSLKERDHLENL